MTQQETAELEKSAKVPGYLQGLASLYASCAFILLLTRRENLVVTGGLMLIGGIAAAIAGAFLSEWHETKPCQEEDLGRVVDYKLTTGSGGYQTDSVTLTLTLENGARHDVGAVGKEELTAVVLGCHLVRRYYRNRLYRKWLTSAVEIALPR